MRHNRNLKLHNVARGRPFAPGNPGRRPGSRNRVTVVASALLEGEAEHLLRKAVELAKSGDRQMLKFLLGRILPRERMLKLAMPQMDTADDGVEAIASVMHAVSEGHMTPSEGANVVTILKCYGESIELADVVKRVDALESQIKGSAR